MKLTQAEARAEWVKDLRSMKYMQGTGVLRNKNDCFCCLGVGCETMRRCEGKEELQLKMPGYGHYQYGKEKTETNAPQEFLKWTGLSSRCGDYLNGESLVDLNDDNQIVFFKIADLIEAEPEGLFK